MILPPKHIGLWTLKKIEQASPTSQVICYTLKPYLCCIEYHVPTNTITHYWTRKDTYYFRFSPFQVGYRTPRPYTPTLLRTILNPISTQLILNGI